MLNYYYKIHKILNSSEKKNLIFLIIVKFTTSILELFGIASIFPFITAILDENFLQNNKYLKILQSKLSLEYDATIIFLGVFSLSVILVTQFFRIFNSYFEKKVINEIWLNLSRKLYNLYLMSPYLFHLQNSSIKLQEQIQVQVNAVPNGLVGPSISIISSIFSTLIIFLFLFILNFNITLIIVTLLSSFYLIINFYLKKKIKIIGEFAPYYSNKTFKLVDQSLRSIKDIIINKNYIFYNAKFTSLAKKYISNIIKLNIYSGFPRILIESLIYIFIFLIIFYIISIDKTLNSFIPLIVVFLMAFQKTIPAIQNIYQQFIEIKYYLPSFDAIYENVKKSIEVSLPNQKNENILDFQNNIELFNISFSYDENNTKFKIKIPHLKIKKNSFVCITGRTGSGKTTLIDILIGLHNLNKGVIKVDGVSISKKNVDAWHNLISYVPQNIFLADDTIINNIALATYNNHINFERIQTAVKNAELSNFIENELDKKYETQIGEGGVRISGGQRQRIGIARALYKERKILILDESTNSLDNETEKKIIKNIQTLKEKKTLIMITHNFNIMKECKNVIFIDEKKDIYFNSFDELSLNNKSFKELLSPSR